MNNIQKCQEAEKQGLRVQHGDGLLWITCNYLDYDDDDCFYRIHPDDLHKFIDPDIKTENPEKIPEKSPEFSEKSSEILENPKEFMEILTNIQKILLKSSKDFKFSYETQEGKTKIQIEFLNDSVKQEDEGWISNEGNSTCTWPNGYGITEETRVEVKYRDNTSDKGAACCWEASWCEVDGKSWDIVKFRIVQ
jgi:DNA polymerase III epsilon subunit-like protein